MQERSTYIRYEFIMISHIKRLSLCSSFILRCFNLIPLSIFLIS